MLSSYRFYSSMFIIDPTSVPCWLGPCVLACCIVELSKCCQVASSMWQRCDKPDLEIGVIELLGNEICRKRAFSPAFDRVYTFTKLSWGIVAIWGCWKSDSPKYWLFPWTVCGQSKRARQHCLKTTLNSSLSLQNLSHSNQYLEILTRT